MAYMDLVTARKRYWQFQFGESVKGVSVGLILLGTEGWIWVSRAGMRTYPESLMRTMFGPNDVRVLRRRPQRQLPRPSRDRSAYLCPVSQYPRRDHLPDGRHRRPMKRS
jgi:hypothetical protein